MILTKDMHDVLEYIRIKILQEYDMNYEQTISIVEMIEEALQSDEV